MVEITEDAADFDGDDLIIRGNGCSGCGRRCTLYGNRIDIADADGAIVYGHHCELWCEDPSTIRVYGHHTRINGEFVTEQPRPVARRTSMTAGRDRERDRDVNSAPGGIAASRAVACSVRNSNAGGGTFTGGNISVGSKRAVVVIDDDDDVPPPANIVVMNGVGSVRGGHISVGSDGVRVVASSARRPPPNRLPRGHTCMRASDGEQACAVCMDNRVDAVLQPCGHANMCVDCAATLYRTKAPCPVCSRKISSVVAAFFGGVAT